MVSLSTVGGPLSTTNERVAERGIALILTLWIIIVLGVTATYFSREVRQEAFIVRNFKQSEEAKLLALAGVHHALALLSHPTEEGMNIDGRYLEQYFSDIDSVAFGEGSYEVEVSDEESKININLASRDLIRGLLIGQGLASGRADSISDAIIDWRDHDDTPMLNGAEDDYYNSLDPPYSCKDSNFDSIEELLLVRGIDRELLFGSGSKGASPGLYEHLTVYGRGKININTADSLVLRALPGVDEQSSAFITRKREAVNYSPLNKQEFIDYIREANQMGEGNLDYRTLQRLVDTKSYHFSILSRGRVDGTNVERSLRVVVYRTILGSKVNLRILSWRELEQGDNA